MAKYIAALYFTFHGRITRSSNFKKRRKRSIRTRNGFAFLTIYIYFSIERSDTVYHRGMQSDDRKASNEKCRTRVRDRISIRPRSG